MAHVYRHIRLDNNEVFYIGISYEDTDKRSHSYDNRNKYWHNIVNKCEYEIEVIFEHKDYKFIQKKEIEFISLYGRKDKGLGTLVNMTDGGEGVLGRIMSDEQKEKLKISTGLFFKGVPKSEEHRKKIGNAHRGREGKRGIENHNFGKKLPERCGLNNHKSRIILDTQTGIFYSCVREATEVYELNYSTLRAYLQGKNKNITSLIYC